MDDNNVSISMNGTWTTMWLYHVISILKNWDLIDYIQYLNNPLTTVFKHPLGNSLDNFWNMRWYAHIIIHYCWYIPFWHIIKIYQRWDMIRGITPTMGIECYIPYCERLLWTFTVPQGVYDMCLVARCCKNILVYIMMKPLGLYKYSSCVKYN